MKIATTHRALCRHCDIRISVFVFLFLLNIPLLAQNTPLPYFNGFENPQDTLGWTFKKRDNASGFFVGTAAHCLGMKSMYISPDSGTTASYSTQSFSYLSLAYKSFTLPAGTYTLAFDYQCGGDSTNQDMKVAFLSSSTALDAASLGTYPTVISLNQFIDYDMKSTFSCSAWRHVTGRLTVPSDGSYNLCFAFRCNSTTATPPGACVDNIQLDTLRSSADCTLAPYDIQVVRDSSGLIISWSGNAQEYEVISAVSNNPDDFSYCRHTSVTATSDTMLYSELSEGQHFIYVRAICGSDTGMFGEISGVLVYDPSQHCFDYINFNAAGTRCTYGSYTNPYQTSGYIDNGPSQMSSRHTVHTDLNETDPRTGGALHTIPPGELASVRLGNWNWDAEAESITYTYAVPDSSDIILQVRYAVLFEEPAHDEPPEFLFEIMDENNVYLDTSCTKYNALCDGTLTNGWHQYVYTSSSSSSTIWWKEWTTIGVNISAYAGQTIKLRLTTKDCNWGGHFGYAYFSIGCAEARITGSSCGSSSATEFKAPDGFDYQWTNNCTSQVVSTAQALPISGTDTCSYTCRCSFKENSGCSFSLTAYIPRLPESSFSYTLSYHDCQAHISFSNNSQVCLIKDGAKIYLPSETISSQTWTLRSRHSDRSYSNLTSADRDLSTIVIPAEGDTIDVTLTSWLNDCDDDTTITIFIPSINERNHTVERVIIFQGDSYTWNGDEYSEPGDYDISFTTAEGCDSLATLHLVVIFNAGIDNVANMDMEIIPNPVRTGGSVIIYTDITDVLSVQILTCTGLLVQKFTPHTYPIPLNSHLPSGNYFVRLITRTGDVYVRALIVL